MASFLLWLLEAVFEVQGEAGKLLLLAMHAGPRPRCEQAAATPRHLNVTLERKVFKQRICLASAGSATVILEWEAGIRAQGMEFMRYGG